MKKVKAVFSILDDLDGKLILEKIERSARICYKSEENTQPGSAEKLIRFIIERGHESVLEHEKISVKIVCDRGISHEIVRHRIASYSQESTRYCNYSKDKFGNEIAVIEPFFWTGQESIDKLKVWEKAMEYAEKAYFDLLSLGATPQEARSILPNSLKTELVMTMNLREWRHFFKLRTSPAAHPQMIEISKPLLNELKSKIPVVFDDIES